MKNARAHLGIVHPKGSSCILRKDSVNHRSRLPAAASLNSEADPDDPGHAESGDEDKLPEEAQADGNSKLPDDAFDVLDDVILGMCVPITV